MPDLETPTRGQCRCGQVQFEVNVTPLLTMACHCTGCQKMSASAFSLSSLYPSAAFTVTSGDPVIGGLHGATRHFFCGHCMSWLFTRPEGMDDFVNVRTTMMDDAQAHTPFVESYTDEKLPWAVTAAEHSFAKFPSMEDVPGLLAKFAAQSQR